MKMMHTGGAGGWNPQELTPIILPIAAEAESVLVRLLRFSSTDGGRHQWTSRRIGNAHSVLLTLQNGPLAELRLRFAAFAGEDFERPRTAVWVTGEFATHPWQLDGVLERWRARREACALRDEVLEALQALARSQSATPEAATRAYARWQVTAAARLDIGGRIWRAEVMDVSEGGLSMAIAIRPTAVERDRHFFLVATSADVEILIQRQVERAEAAIRSAVPGRGGVRVGLALPSPDATTLLLRRALAQRRSGGVPLPSPVDYLARVADLEEDGIACNTPQDRDTMLARGEPIILAPPAPTFVGFSPRQSQATRVG